MPSKTLDAQLIDANERLAWRLSLPEAACRELATEYMGALHRAKGDESKVDIMLCDAYSEYMDKYFEDDQKNDRDMRKNKGKGKNLPKRRTSRYK